MKPIIGEIIRFGLVGITCTALHYALYYVMQLYIYVNIVTIDNSEDLRIVR